MISRDIPQNAPGIVPDKPYAMQLGDGQLWIRAGFVVEPHHMADGQQPHEMPQGHDSLYAIPEKGAFVVCDGASGETEGQMDPARSARVAAKFLVEQFAAIPHGMSVPKLEEWANDQMESATMYVDYAGGGMTTAIAAGPTLDEQGRPMLFVASRGDSRAAIDHNEEPANLSLQYWERARSFGNFAYQYDQRLADGFGPYEISADRGFSTWVGTPSKKHTQSTQSANLLLQPQTRERLVMVTDGIAGSEYSQGQATFLSHDVVETAMKRGTPQESISHLLRNSTKHDDKAGFTIDWGYVPGKSL